ncbi:hypothetical protein V6N12_000056 [Hibiscus sabdariffa]|uniref:Uncharacterized protein n=1 Tax=Hibiscus sabdariffa TaxID=183260 RepID=A0ABR2ADY5_9ROSI
MAPAFPAAAEIPWQVDLNLAGKISAGTTNVVALGPKFAKKKVNEYMMRKPAIVSFPVMVWDGKCKHEDSHEEEADQLDREPADVVDQCYGKPVSRDRATERDKCLSPRDPINLVSCTHESGIRKPADCSEDVFLEQIGAVKGNVQ